MARDSKYRGLDWLCYVLLIVGALNWGILGLVEMNVLEHFFDLVFQPSVADVLIRVVYMLVGIAGIYFFFPLYRIYRMGKRQTTV